MKKKVWGYCLSVLSIVTILLLWMAVSYAGNSLIPTPAATFQRFLQIMTEPISYATLPGHVWMSLLRVLIAFGFAIVFGITLGVLLGWNKTFRMVVGPIFEIFRPIPPIAWIPLVILWCGIRETPKIVIVFIGSFVPIVVNTYTGISMADPLLVKMGKVLGCRSIRLLVEVVIPTALPSIFAGIKTALSSGWMCVLAAEMVAAKLGVGFLIVRGMESGDSALILVCMVVIGVVSAGISWGLTRLERILCRWNYMTAK